MDDSEQKRSGVKTDRRLAGYLLAACSRWSGRQVRIDPAVIARTFGVSIRSIRRAIAVCKLDSRFVFHRRRLGRSFALYVAVQGDKPHYREDSPAENKDCTPSRWQNFKRGGVGIFALAWAMARNDLADLHWDNCKVVHRPRIAFALARWALNSGRLQEDILSAYRSALVKYHQIATDAGNNEGTLTRYEPTGVYSMARRLLA